MNKKNLLVVLAVVSLSGCASAPQSVSGFTGSLKSLAQRVGFGAGAAPAPTETVQAKAPGDDYFHAQYALALRGDRDAMVEVARIYGRGSNGIARDDRAMVEWLRQASAMRHAGASYQLYLHYLERGMDRDAVRYEQLALRQGYVLPARLDPRRG